VFSGVGFTIAAGDEDLKLNVFICGIRRFYAGGSLVKLGA
jgi:hypothetical protein